MSASNPCGNGTINTTWYGVECSIYNRSSCWENTSLHVTGLVLPENNLVGKLPPLRSLKYLLRVDFSNPHSPEVPAGLSNTVGGTLDAFCGLGDISTVQLASNNFTGSIPDCIQELVNATELDLNYNAIEGITPDELCHLSNLEKLQLRGNRLQGTVPVCIGEAMAALRILDYSNLDINYRVGSQSLSGTVPTSLCNLENLEVLLFQNTHGLHGTLPDCLGKKQPQLKSLQVQKNQFYGTIPPSVCQATALEDLNLWSNALTGTIPSCLGSLSQLIDFTLCDNLFHGTMPEELCHLTALEFLLLYDNALTGTIPSCLGSLSQLTGLELRTNHFHGSIPKELCQASAIEYLHLYENALTGTMPSCLGSLSQLSELYLSNNRLYGSMPEELCLASALELLHLDSNLLTGNLPACLTTSFPFLKNMLLHDNDLDGVLPSEWALSSLVSIILSNNPKLSGTLPTGLFLQQVGLDASESRTSPNIALRAVVIEGTSIGGTLPAALCSAPQLATLAFSGNKFTGSLPDCVVSFQNMHTLRISNNHLTGSLPVAINNMTSLTVLDLSRNLLQGRVPSALGDISSNFDTMQLQINRLSCDLPASVLGWQASSANVSFSLLDGNLFGCSTSNYRESVSLSIQGATGLRNANEKAFDAYSCGNSDYVLPVFTAASLAVPVVVWLAVLYCRSRLACKWWLALGRMINPSALINEHDRADRQIRALALGVMAAATVAGSVALIVSLYVAKSAFECEYMAAPTLANKRDSDMHELSIGIGIVVCVGLLLGLSLWWRSLVVECVGGTNSSGIASNNKPLYQIEEDAKGRESEAEQGLDAAPNAFVFRDSVRVLKLGALLLVLVFLTIGPNVGYVLVVLSSELALKQKIASEMAVTLVKTMIGTLLVPLVAREAVDLLVLDDALTYVRFRLRVAIATALSATTMIVLPVMIVLVTDKRCLYHTIEPQPAVHTNVPISYCAIFKSSTRLCLEYATIQATSTYKPSFAYDGGVCVSAILSVYGPVFLGTVLLAATLPAGIERIVVPWLAPRCYQNAESSMVARTGLAFLQAVTWNVWPALAKAGVLPLDFSLGTAKLDYLAQRVVERAFMRVMVTLILALTFGIAVPVVGGACAIAVFVQLLHHRHVLGQIVALGRLEQPVVVPNLMGCTDVPAGCAVVVVVTVVLVWVCGAVSYLEPAVVGVTILIGLSASLAACVGVEWWRTSRIIASQHQGRVQSTASSGSSRVMLMESLIDDDELAKGEEIE
jgi:Leucine-rich repeat (LRR) protein